VAATTFQHTHRVTYSECTLGNHIYYSRYLDLLEAARGEFFRHLGVTFLQLQEHQTIFPVIEARLLYKAPARYDDLLTIQLWLTAAERIRLNFSYHILNQHQTLLLQATTSHICATTDDKPQRLPADLLPLLQPYLNSAS
jgi:acyl-CoA thioester hydrolase